MRASVYLYDSACAVLRQALDISAVDKRGVVLSLQTATALGTEWGALLTWSKPAKPNIFEVLVDDPRGKWAPFHAGDLNGNPGGRVDAVIYPVPKPSGFIFSQPAVYGQIEPYISEQADWSDNEKDGMRRLVDVYPRFLSTTDDDMLTRLERWGEALRKRGINPDLFRAHASYL